MLEWFACDYVVNIISTRAHDATSLMLQIETNWRLYQ